MGRGNIVKNLPRGYDPQIPKQAAEPPKDKTHFSFKYLNLKHKKCNARNCVKIKKDKIYSYLESLLERLKNLSSWTVLDLRQHGNNDSIRCHPINWNDTTHPNGFDDLDSQLWDGQSYQISISKSSFGRIHGFIHDASDTFYIVWLDPGHKLDPRGRPN